MTGTDFITWAAQEFPGITPAQQAQFQAMEALYREWNAKINVISRKDIDHLYDHHVLHSLAIAKYLQMVPEAAKQFVKASVLDFGTGGGFPGLPLAILFPEARFTLCDSVGKKVMVTEAIAKELNLSNIETINARGETLRGRYGFVVSRAVAPLPDFYRWVKGKYVHGALYLKGGDIAAEIAGMMGQFRQTRRSVSTWRINAWLHDPYFEGKYVIHIRQR